MRGKNYLGAIKASNFLGDSQSPWLLSNKVYEDSMAKVKDYYFRQEDNFIMHYGFRPSLCQLQQYVDAWDDKPKVCGDCKKVFGPELQEICEECEENICTTCWTIGHSHYGKDRHCD